MRDLIRYKTVPPWRTGYAIPGYIREGSMFELGSAYEAMGRIDRPYAGGSRGAQPLLKKMDWPLPDGPRLMLGPLNFSATKTTHLTITQQWFGSRKGLPTQKYIGKMLGQVMEKWKAPCRTNMPALQWMTGGGCRKDYKGWSVNQQMPLNLWRGKYPIAVIRPEASPEQLEQAKTDQELGRQIGCLYRPDGTLIACRRFKPWGLYARFEQGAIHLTFKTIDQGLFDRIFGLVAAVTGKLITSAIDVLEYAFDLMKSLACMAAGPAMQQLMAYATGKISLGLPPTKPSGMSAEEYAHQKKGWDAVTQAGISNADIAKLRKGASSALVTDISNKVSKAFCGGSDVLTDDTSTGLPSWVLPAAAVAGVGLAAFLLR